MSALVADREARSVDRWAVPFERVGDLRMMAVLRILLGPVTLLHLAPFLRDARAGVHYDDHFWEPYLSWAPSPPGELWTVVLYVGAVAAVLMMLGVLTRLSTTVTFVVVAGNLLLSQVHFRHNRTFLAILLGGLALVPAGRVLSVDAWWRRARGAAPLPPAGPTWPLFLLRTQVSLVYLASGISKLVDPDWLSGLVLWDRVVRYQHVLDPLPEGVVDLLTTRSLYWLVAPAAILVELSLGVGLWFTRTRLAALWLAIVFHLSIEVSAKVEVFSYGAIAALVIWVTPAARDRVVRLRTDDPAARALAAAVRTLDWFGRFRVEPPRPGDPPVTVVDRDGRILSGRAAARLVLTRLPVTFPVAVLLSRRSMSRSPMSLRRRLSLTALVWVVGFGALRISVLAPESCPPVSDATALDAAAAAARWITAGQARRRSLPLRVRPRCRRGRARVQRRPPRRRHDVALPAGPPLASMRGWRRPMRASR